MLRSWPDLSRFCRVRPCASGPPLMRPDEPDLLIRNPDLLRRGEPFVQALRTIKLTGVLASTVAIGPGPWATSMPHGDDCIVLYVLTKGSCVAGILEPREFVELREGDALLLPRPGRYTIAQNPNVAPVPLEELLQREFGRLHTVEEKWKALFASPFLHHLSNGGAPVVGMTALRLFFDQKFPSAILKGLPALIRLEGFVARNHSFVQAVLSQIVEQGERGLTGQDAATRLAEALLVQCLSEFLVSFGEHRPGFVRGLKDPFLAKVIGAIQTQPGARWTLQAMSRAAGLSRSAFAERFRTTMGMTPAQFLTAVRMARALEMLVNGQNSIARIADFAGYGSEAAFSRAFRKWSGSPPGSLRRSGPASTPSIGSARTADHSKQHPG
jgi:AraC-like DNA-binding protein